MAYFTVVYEDVVHYSVLEKIFEYHGKKHSIYRQFSRGGSGYIKINFNAFNAASRHGSYLILTDLDNFECPPTLIADWKCDPINPQLIFCIAVKEVEAWLLADRHSFARFFSVSIDRLPLTPELVPDPKLKIIELAKVSRKRVIQQGIVPKGAANVGADYNNILSDFIYNHWEIKAAMQNSDSLKRVLNKLASHNIA